jgi:S1-C subfamily serine protease
MVAAAAATGAAMVSAFDTGNPPWVQGSAWLIADDRVVTNRHVLRSTDLDLIVVDASGVRFRHGVSMTIEFAADNRNPAATVSKRVTEILYVSDRQDPVDIAVLRIDGGNAAPLTLATGPAPRNLYVVGHPGLALSVSETVRVVFGNPDGRKRVSFGKRLDVELRRGEFLHDASTVGGFSGGPVVGMLDGTVIGLHYYGDPQTGNMAFSTDKVRADPAFHYLA